MYLTSPEVRYILVGNLAEEVYETLPEVMNKEIKNINELKNIQGKAKLIFFNTLPAAEQLPTTKEDISIVKIEGDLNEGKIIFFDSNLNKEGESKYIKKELLLGGIFAENIEYYACAKEKAEKKFDVVTAIYQNRIDQLINEYGDCNGLLQRLPPTLSLSNIHAVETQNYQLQIEGCPTIY